MTINPFVTESGTFVGRVVVIARTFLVESEAFDGIEMALARSVRLRFA